MCGCDSLSPKNDPEGNGVVVDPAARLEEELIIRPTSETIIWNTYKNWIHSYRDLPILVKPVGECVPLGDAHENVPSDSRIPVAGRTHRTRHSRGGRKESRKMLDVYADFAQNYMAVPVIKGVKTPSERFAGAIDTFTIEAMMQDGKALQSVRRISLDRILPRRSM